MEGVDNIFHVEEHIYDYVMFVHRRIDDDLYLSQRLSNELHEWFAYSSES